MRVLINWVLDAVAILIAAYMLPGIHINDVLTAFLLAVVLGVINAIIRPVLFILTLPITILTLGLFTLVLNALLILLASVIVPGFTVDGFWWALLFGIILFIVNSLVHFLGGTKNF